MSHAEQLEELAFNAINSGIAYEQLELALRRAAVRKSDERGDLWTAKRIGIHRNSLNRWRMGLPDGDPLKAHRSTAPIINRGRRKRVVE